MKKRKIFVQCHPVMIFVVNPFFIMVLCWGLFYIIQDPLLNSFYGNFHDSINAKRILLLLATWGGFLVFSLSCIQLNHHWVSFNKEFIFVPFDCRTKQSRIQYTVKVKYQDIKEIYFERSTKSSKNTTIKGERRRFYHQYLVLILESGRKEKILLDYFTKKQKHKILYEIDNRMKIVDKELDLTRAKETLTSIGSFGWGMIIDISEQIDKKKR